MNYAAIRFMRERGTISADEAAALEAGALPAPPPQGSLRSSRAD